MFFVSFQRVGESSAALDPFFNSISTMEDEALPCRICGDIGREPLDSPCRCSGSISKVHLECLTKWVQKRQLGHTRCEVCQACYDVVGIPHVTIHWDRFVGSLILTLIPALGSVYQFLWTLLYGLERPGWFLYFPALIYSLSCTGAIFLMIYCEAATCDFKLKLRTNSRPK